MNFYRHHWYYVGGVLFVALAYVMGFWGNNVSRIQVILIYSFMAMLIHQLEEYAIPGGFPAISNIATFGEKQVPDRYPLNANQCLISNVFLTYPFFIVTILLPHVIWLGLAQVGMGLFQVLAHGIAVNVRVKSLYNPGMASAVLLFLPIGIYYIWYVATNHLASTGDYVIGGIATVGAVVVLFLAPILLLRNRASKYPFSETEMVGLAKERVAKIMAS